ncbi:MAG: hypothetical protein GQ574_09125 [Crocinitomix sp.]|nr:hypothetical protein [Crocinitomix sp.]
MSDQEILDSNIGHKIYKELLLSLCWWEKKRITFNIVVGISGVTGILLAGLPMYYFDFVGIIFCGLFLNLCYSVGFLLEAFDGYYFKGKLQLFRFRLLFFIFGLLGVTLFVFIVPLLLPVI